MLSTLRFNIRIHEREKIELYLSRIKFLPFNTCTIHVHEVHKIELRMHQLKLAYEYGLTLKVYHTIRPSYLVSTEWQLNLMYSQKRITNK